MPNPPPGPTPPHQTLQVVKVSFCFDNAPMIELTLTNGDVYRLDFYAAYHVFQTALQGVMTGKPTP